MTPSTVFSRSLPRPKMGPEPVLLSRKEVDVLYVTLQAVIGALEQLGVDYIVTGGSLLGAVRQHSILFCDDDIDIAIIEREGTGAYQHVSSNLQYLLGEDFTYSIRPWEGGDRVRPKKMSSVFLDLFTIRRFESIEHLVELIGVKKNGKLQSDEYIQDLLEKIQTSAHSQDETFPLCPFWHFNTRKAIEMWAKEVYREHELFPLSHKLKFGPLTGIKGPRMPVKLLKRAFGLDCFEVYFQSASHKNKSDSKKQELDGKFLPPHTKAGGSWEGGNKVNLEDKHYLPMQPVLKSKRRPTCHDKEALVDYLVEQSRLEEEWSHEDVETAHADDTTIKAREQEDSPPMGTVYMDGVFDLFHIGHLKAIRQSVNFTCFSM